MFLEFWKRKQNENEFEWDVADFELEEVRILYNSLVMIFYGRL